MVNRCSMPTVLLVLVLLFSMSGLAVAGIDWSIKPVTQFTMPANNMIVQGEVLGALPPGWTPTYNWVTYNIDSTSYLTGTSSVQFETTEVARGRVYIDIGVDSSQTYKVGWIVKIADLVPKDDNGALVWGVFLKDVNGAWVNSNEPLKSLPSDYLKGLEASGIVIRTPRNFDGGTTWLSGSTDWFLVEMVLDLPKLAKDLKAGGGQITTLRFEQLLDSGTGKVWLDGMYLVPVQ